jgi:site-specific DNA-cytosine methylase
VRELAARHGLSEAFVAEWWTRNRLKVERAHNRDALKAYGNSVVPQVVAIIGKAILEADREQR